MIITLKYHLFLMTHMQKKNLFQNSFIKKNFFTNIKSDKLLTRDNTFIK